MSHTRTQGCRRLEHNFPTLIGRCCRKRQYRRYHRRQAQMSHRRWNPRVLIGQMMSNHPLRTGDQATKKYFSRFFSNLIQLRKNKIIFEISDKHYDCLYKKIFIKICRSKIAQFGPNSLLTSLCPVQLKHWDWVPHERPWLQQHSLWLICVSEKFNKDFKKACFIFE